MKREGDALCSARFLKSTPLFERAAGYGMPSQRDDGNDPIVVREAVAGALERARAGGGPSLIEAMTQRLVGHYIGDAEAYRRPAEIERLLTVEPVGAVERTLRSARVEDAELAVLQAEVEQQVDAAAEAALAAPAVTLADAEGIVEAAAAAGTKVAVNQQMRCRWFEM